jgi:hypothetical protein
VDNAAPTYRNDNLAKAIVWYRDIDGDPNPAVKAPHGAFKSIYELNQVVDLRLGAAPNFGPPAGAPAGYPAGTLYGFQNGYGTLPLPIVGMGTGPSGPDDAHGDDSPLNIGGTPVLDTARGDFEEQFLELNRISNLITTRSDSFTCYILIQGWRDAETPNAQMVVQRRVGYLMDRSRLTPSHSEFIKRAFPND